MTREEAEAFEADLRAMRAIIASVMDLARGLDAATEAAISRLRETTT